MNHDSPRAWMADHIVADFDDFEDVYAAWALEALDVLRRESNGEFKATLFTIPARTSCDTLAEVAKRPWLELAVHGWEHTPLECQAWTAERMRECMAQALAQGCEHDEADSHYRPIFKAPYWEASDACYLALAEAGWAVADHPRNVHRLPHNLRRYVLAPDHGVGRPHHLLPVVQAHGHIPDVENNGIRQAFARFRGLGQWKLPYAFVSEVAI